MIVRSVREPKINKVLYKYCLLSNNTNYIIIDIEIIKIVYKNDVFSCKKFCYIWEKFGYTYSYFLHKNY